MGLFLHCLPAWIPFSQDIRKLSMKATLGILVSFLYLLQSKSPTVESGFSGISNGAILSVSGFHKNSLRTDVHTRDGTNLQCDFPRKFGFPSIVRNIYRPTDFKGRISQCPFLPNDAFDGRSGITKGKGSICEFPFNSTRDSFHVTVFQKNFFSKK